MSRSFNTVVTLPAVLPGASMSNVFGPAGPQGNDDVAGDAVHGDRSQRRGKAPFSVKKSPLLLVIEYSSGVPPGVEVTTTSWTELSPVITMLSATPPNVSMDTLTMPVSICRASSDSKRSVFELAIRALTLLLGFGSPKHRCSLL